MKRYIYGLFLLLSLAPLSALWGQPPALHLGLQGQSGLIIAHSESIREVATTTPWGLKADFSWHFRERRAWSYCQCFPRLGVSLEYVNFGNPEVLGRAYPVSFWVEPVFGADKRLSAALRFGFGVAYLDQVYDPETNPTNLFFSAPISFLLLVNANLRYRLNDRWALQLNANYNHISNGGTREPNKGINYPAVSLGMDYTLRHSPFPKHEPPSRQAPDSLRREWQFTLLGSAQTANNTDPQRYPLIGLMGQRRWRFHRMHAVTAGAEWVLDYSLRERLRQEPGAKSNDFHRGALLIGHELWLGRFAFSQQLGVYVYAPNERRDPVYQRFGLDFRATRHWVLGMNLKTHLHVADFFDLRIGYVW